MKFIKFLQFIVSTVFVVLFSMFCLYVYNDNKQPVEYESTIEQTIEIEPVIISKQNVEEPEKEKIELKKEEEPKQEITKSNVNRFYYGELDEYSKLIYDTIESNKSALRTGNAKIALPKKLGEIVESEKNIEAIFSIAINAFECDNPDLFYFDPSKIVLYYEKSTLGNFNIYLKNGDEYNSYLVDGFNNEADVNNAQNEIESVVSKIEDTVQNISGDYNKILYIHDWLVENVKYDESLSRTNKDGI